jgi:hypothetical protein
LEARVVGPILIPGEVPDGQTAIEASHQPETLLR